jgi:maltose alpha-D-glucosyltransferase/alpha-amylase
MQWRNERNAGFSTATPEELYLPVIDDPVYGFQGVNVDAQRRNPGSFLRWLKDLLEVRRRHPQLALGDYVPLPVENQAVLAYLRSGIEEAPSPLLCVANLDNRAQPATLPLHGFEGTVPHELIGGVPFPAVTDDGYPVTLGPRSFLAFELR